MFRHVRNLNTGTELHDRSSSVSPRQFVLMYDGLELSEFGANPPLTKPALGPEWQFAADLMVVFCYTQELPMLVCLKPLQICILFRRSLQVTAW